MELHPERVGDADSPHHSDEKGSGCRSDAEERELGCGERLRKVECVFRSDAEERGPGCGEGPRKLECRVSTVCIRPSPSVGIQRKWDGYVPIFTLVGARLRPATGRATQAARSGATRFRGEVCGDRSQDSGAEETRGG